MANLITSARLILLFVLVGMAYTAPPFWQLFNPFLLVMVILLDALDGYVARMRGETSVFGSVYDIAADRVVENVLWIILADLGLVPLWVTLLIVTRGLLTDAIRSQGAAVGMTPYGMMDSPVGRFIVAGRFMRGFYGTVKAVVFAWILAFKPVPLLWPAWWAQWSDPVEDVAALLVYLTVFLCILRGIPVLVEFYLAQSRPQHREAAGSG
jgi:CDP-diacylglycerol--glycerol-3-phosphate 3-phosphatidyltransferase